MNVLTQDFSFSEVNLPPEGGWPWAGGGGGDGGGGRRVEKRATDPAIVSGSKSRI